MSDVDMSTAKDLLDELHRLQGELHGAAPDTGKKSATTTADRAATSRKLQYMAHLARQLTLEAEHQYFRFKGLVDDEAPPPTYRRSNQ